MALFSAYREKLMLRLMRRKEYESAFLRRYFKDRYGTAIGLYSYGCFDRWRIPTGSTIGRYCSFANSARILDANHPIDALSTHPYFYDPSFGVVATEKVVKTRIVVEDDVWVSHNATITPGCAHIGRGAIIGAGSVVTRDVPAYAIVAGAPAKVLRRRFDADTIAAIEASRWWELDRNELKALVARDPAFAFAPSSSATRVA